MNIIFVSLLMKMKYVIFMTSVFNKCSRPDREQNEIAPEVPGPFPVPAISWYYMFDKKLLCIIAS